MNFNIGFLSNVFFPVTNGVVHSLHLLAKTLRNKGNNVFVITSKHPNFNDHIIRKYSINYEVIDLPSIYLRKIDYCFPNPLNFFFIDKKIVNKKIDILQLNHPFFIYNLAKKIEKIYSNIKKVFVFHTQYDQYHHYIKFVPFNLYINFLWRHIKDVISNVDVVVVPSKSMMSKIKQNIDNYLHNKLIYIPNPVDDDIKNTVDFDKINTLKEELNLRGKFVLGFVGRIEKEKNLETLINFFNKNLNSYDDVVLLVVGAGSHLNYLKSKYSFNNKIIFTGKVDFKEIGNYYKLIDIFISMSLTEVKPLAYLEALISGVPIIAFNTFGADDLVVNGYNGFLVNNEQEFLSSILRLYSNKDLINQFKINSIISAREFSYNNVSEKYIELYKNLRNV